VRSPGSVSQDLPERQLAAQQPEQRLLDLPPLVLQPPAVSARER
jgi:hypothetical protein